MPRLLLLLPTATYRAGDFLAAAAALGAEVVVASERRQALAGSMGDRAVVVSLADAGRAADAIVDLATRSPLDGIVAVDDQGVVAAALAAQRLGLPHNPPAAVARTRDKVAMRKALAGGGGPPGGPGVPQPAWAVAGPDDDVGLVAAALGFPCVVKPTTLSASRGVIRADDVASARAAGARARAIAAEAAAGERGGGPTSAAGHGLAQDWDHLSINTMLKSPQSGPGALPLLIERFVPGPEVALEGLLRGGRLQVLALFDKPDPLEGPFFEETIYVTPSSLRAEVRRTVAEVTAEACRALGLVEGPVHAELRVSAGPVGDGREAHGGEAPHAAAAHGGGGGSAPPDREEARAWVIEVAARSIGGLCSRALSFGTGRSLEQLIVAHALGRPLDGVSREDGAAGVMMLPIPAAGVLAGVEGLDRARAVPGITGLEISILPGRPVRPLPEGDRYLGFLFAKAEAPAQVEAALRRAYAELDVRIG